MSATRGSVPSLHSDAIAGNYSFESKQEHRRLRQTDADCACRAPMLSGGRASHNPSERPSVRDMLDSRKNQSDRTDLKWAAQIPIQHFGMALSLTKVNLFAMGETKFQNENQMNGAACCPLGGSIATLARHTRGGCSKKLRTLSHELHSNCPIRRCRLPRYLTKISKVPPDIPVKRCC